MSWKSARMPMGAAYAIGNFSEVHPEPEFRTKRSESMVSWDFQRPRSVLVQIRQLHSQTFSCTLAPQQIQFLLSVAALLQRGTARDPAQRRGCVSTHQVDGPNRFQFELLTRAIGRTGNYFDFHHPRQAAHRRLNAGQPRNIGSYSELRAAQDDWHTVAPSSALRVLLEEDIIVR